MHWYFYMNFILSFYNTMPLLHHNRAVMIRGTDKQGDWIHTPLSMQTFSQEQSARTKNYTCHGHLLHLRCLLCVWPRKNRFCIVVSNSLWNINPIAKLNIPLHSSANLLLNHALFVVSTHKILLPWLQFLCNTYLNSTTYFFMRKKWYPDWDIIQKTNMG
jgi:hypothetical protein